MHCTWLWICYFFCFFRLCHCAWWQVLLYTFVWIWILLILFELYIIVTIIYIKISMRTTIIRLPKLRDISKKCCEGAHTILGFSSRQRLGLSTSGTSVGRSTKHDLRTSWLFRHWNPGFLGTKPMEKDFPKRWRCGWLRTIRESCWVSLVSAQLVRHVTAHKQRK